MPSCPKCSFSLVLIKDKPRYRCSVCRKSYPQRDIDAKEFRNQNARQKEFDLEISSKEFEREWLEQKSNFLALNALMGIVPKKVDLSEEERRKRSVQATARWRRNNKEKAWTLYHNYYQKHKARIKETRKVYQRKNRAYLTAEKNERRGANPLRTAIFSRLQGWRKMQKRLVLTK